MFDEMTLNFSAHDASSVVLPCSSSIRRATSAGRVPSAWGVGRTAAAALGIIVWRSATERALSTASCRRFFASATVLSQLLTRSSKTLANDRDGM